MRCPSCGVDQAIVARYCGSCGARMTADEAGASSLDLIPETPGIESGTAPAGRFAFSPDATPPPVLLEPTDWSYPMRTAVAAWLAISALLLVATLFQHQDTIAQLAFPSAQVRTGQVSPEDAARATQLFFDAAVVVVIAWALLKLTLAWVVYRGLAIAPFYLSLTLLGINTVLAAVSLVSIVAAALRGQDLSLLLVSLVVQLSAAGLFGWLVVGWRRFGPWAARRVTRPS
jgi:hypothetical protein